MGEKLVVLDKADSEWWKVILSSPIEFTIGKCCVNYASVPVGTRVDLFLLIIVR